MRRPSFWLQENIFYGENTTISTCSLLTHLFKDIGKQKDLYKPIKIQTRRSLLWLRNKIPNVLKSEIFHLKSEKRGKKRDNPGVKHNGDVRCTAFHSWGKKRSPQLYLGKWSERVLREIWVYSCSLNCSLANNLSKYLNLSNFLTQ